MDRKATRVLVVDDFRTMRKLVGGALKNESFEKIEEAENGAKAWELIQKAASEGNPYGLVVSDWNMPEMTGMELLKKIREAGPAKDLPFVMVTAEGEEKNVMEAVKYKVTAMIIKPFSQDSFSQKLKTIPVLN